MPSVGSAGCGSEINKIAGEGNTCRRIFKTLRREIFSREQTIMLEELMIVAFELSLSLT